MTLALLEIGPDRRKVPPLVDRFLEEALAWMEWYFGRGDGRRAPAFVPCDNREVYRALRVLRNSGQLTGRRLCEWGSGLGIVAMLARQLGYDACGIEIEPELVEAARGLAEKHELDVEFACGTFIPPGGEELADRVEEFEWLQPGGEDGYEELGRDLDEFDVVFAYPWPGEEQVLFELFDRYAASGAVLVTYHGRDGVRARRKL